MGIRNSGNFTNENIVHIDTSNTGINNISGGVIVNNALSTIKISNLEGLAKIGLRNWFNSSMQNSGLIEIIDSAEGVRHESGSVYNDASGIIKILNSTDIPISISLGAIFDCQGILDVGN